MTPYDHAPSGPTPGAEPSRNAPEPVYKRSGSQTRRRKNSLQIALDDDELAVVKESAARVGLALSSYGRAALLGTPGPRARRTPHIHAPVIGAATAALNKIGVLFNQIAHVLNAGGALSMGQKYLDTLDDVRLTLRAIREAVGRKDRDDNQGKPA
jgi:hypothetical protein